MVGHLTEEPHHCFHNQQSELRLQTLRVCFQQLLCTIPHPQQKERKWVYQQQDLVDAHHQGGWS